MALNRNDMLSLNYMSPSGTCALVSAKKGLNSSTMDYGFTNGSWYGADILTKLVGTKCPLPVNTELL